MGADNKLRLTGTHETSTYDTFSYSLADRQCSLRLPTVPVMNENQWLTRKFAGYFELRTPSANMDPYVVCALIAQSVTNPTNKEHVNTLINKYNAHINRH